MRKLKLILIFWLGCLMVSAQERYATSTGEVHFNASTPLEDIDAINNRVHAILKGDTGEFAAVLQIQDFSFRRKLMQEHFNENYMESATYPQATFRGKILGLQNTQPGTASGSHATKGILTIHGVSKDIETTATIGGEGDMFTLTCQLTIAPEDYGIEVPKILFQKIAREVAVAIKFELDRKEGSR